MNEAETRAEYIDPALEGGRLGRGRRQPHPARISHHARPHRRHGRRGKPLIADYVLVYRNAQTGRRRGQGLGRRLTEGVAQAKNYAGKMAIRYTYSTNGQGIYGIDMQTGKEGELPRYPTPDELWDLTFAEAERMARPLCRRAVRGQGRLLPGRYYQDIAIDRVLEAIAADRTRILLTLATGTGKTFIAFQIAWKLFHSRWNLSREPSRRPRILFLADRNILADQAYNAFSRLSRRRTGAHRAGGHPQERQSAEERQPLLHHLSDLHERPAEGRQPSPYFGEYPPDFFDFIVIDECHRGGANDESNWRGILEYFAPAVQLGLTATPKRKDNVDTYAYFGEPVYIYSLKEGINDGFLTPFKVKQISTTLDEYVYTPDDKLIEGEIETGKRYTETDFNKIIEIKEREAHRVKLFMEQINQNEKTLVFCATQDHALAVRDLINQMKTSKDPNYCQRVTANDGALGDQHLRDFQDNEKTIPTILTTSQKLSTGVDARNIRNIVLMRPINSMIEFKQIIGRGTRLYDGKDYFTIYDFVKAHHHFSDPEWDGEPLEPEPKGEPKPRSAARAVRADRCARAEPEPPRRQKIKVKLADGKARTIQHMMVHDASGIPTARPCPRSSSWKCSSASCPDFSRTKPSCAPCGARRIRARSSCKVSPKRDSAPSRWRRCKKSSTRKRATSSMCSPTSPTRCPRSRAKNALAARSADDSRRFPLPAKSSRPFSILSSAIM